MTDESKTSSALERSIVVILRAGVGSSLFLVVLGTVVSFVQNPTYRHSDAVRRAITQGRVQVPHSLGGVLSGLSAGKGTGLVLLGLLVLLCTPIARVVVSLWGFAIVRDRKFVIITAVVLAILAASFLLGGVVS